MSNTNFNNQCVCCGEFFLTDDPAAEVCCYCTPKESLYSRPTDDLVRDFDHFEGYFPYEGESS